MKNGGYQELACAVELFCTVHGESARRVFVSLPAAERDGWLRLASKWQARAPMVSVPRRGEGRWFMKQAAGSKP